jgi:ABC-type uncharacterized transport system permease subunit
MLVAKRMQNWKKIVLAIFAIAVLGLIGYLIYTNYFSSSARVVSSQTKKVETLVVPRIDPNFSDDFLSKQPYLNLRSPGDLIFNIESSGKVNPFQ